MLDLLQDLAAWSDRGRPFALATVVDAWGSSPHQPGASMAVDSKGEVVGSVSGGCVNSAVYQVAQEVLSTGRPVLETYGVSDGDAFTLGLTCGGTLQVFFEQIDATSFAGLVDLHGQVAGRQAVAVAVATTVEAVEDAEVGARLLGGTELTCGTLGHPGLDHAR